MVDFVLGDGGMDEIKKYVGSDFERHTLWNGVYLKDNPDVIRTIFQETIQAGAQILLTYTYQTTEGNLQKHYNITKQEALDIIKSSVKIGQEAVELERDRGNTRPVAIVGTIGSYGAILHDGSEYAGGHYVDRMSVEELAEWHRPRFEALVEADCDYLAFCTIPSLKEMEALISLLKRHPRMKAIMSFSAQKEETVSHGERLSDAAVRCWQLAADQIVAVGVNCLHPRLVEPLLRSVKDANPNIPLFAKPNTTEVFNTKTKQWEPSRDPKSLPEYCRDWLRLGVKYISGCCRTTVQDIANFRREIDNFTSKSH